MKTVKLSDLLKAFGLDENGKEIRIEVDCYYTHLSFPNPGGDYPGIGIHFPGYGHNSAPDEEPSEIVLIEWPNGNGAKHPHVWICPDINTEDGDPTSLKGASFDQRKPE